MGISKEARKTLDIDETYNEAGFVNGVSETGLMANFKTPKNEPGKKYIKEFNVDLDRISMLYIKAGWEEMACTKPIEQFNQECKLVVEDDEKWKIPRVLLVPELPDWV